MGKMRSEKIVLTARSEQYSLMLRDGRSALDDNLTLNWIINQENTRGCGLNSYVSA
jgi:hypothetical protein